MVGCRVGSSSLFILGCGVLIVGVGCCLVSCVSVCRYYSSLLFVGACCLLAVVDDCCVALLCCAVVWYLLSCVFVVRGC